MGEHNKPLRTIVLADGNTVSVYARNMVGRDFIVTDLHGALELFERFKNDVSFDPVVDRIFSVGDLVDRGRDSLNTLALLYEEWFHAVKANHENMMIETCRNFNTENGEYLPWVNNGGIWGFHLIKELSDEGMMFRDLVEIADKLPLMIAIEQEDGSYVGVLHAEPNLTKYNGDTPLPTVIDIDAFNRLEEAELNRALLAKDRYGDFDVLWSRRVGGSFCHCDMNATNIRRARRAVTISGQFKELQKLMPLFTGHTIVKQPVKVFNWLFFDCAAWKADLPAGRLNPGWCGLASYNLTAKRLQITNHVVGTADIHYVDLMMESEDDRND